MRPELERLARIEHHLLGHPRPAAEAEWQTQLLLDPNLAADAAAQQQLYKALRAAGQRQLRQELNTIHQSFYGRRRSTWVSAVTAGLRTVLLRWPRCRPQG